MPFSARATFSKPSNLSALRPLCMPKRWNSANGVLVVSAETLKRPLSRIMSCVRLPLLTEMEMRSGSLATCTAVLMMQALSLPFAFVESRYRP